MIFLKALITGASSGIGRDIAKELSKKGYDLILVARNKERLKQVQSEVKTNAQIVIMDVSTPENCQKLHEQFKDIDILVNNAGFGDCGYFTKTDLQKELKMIDTNIVAYHVLTKLYLKDMQSRNSGKILNVASIAGFMPGPVDTNFNKVADVEFALKGLSSEYVAKYTVNKFLKGKFYIIPGWKIKLAKIGSKLAPTNLVAKTSYNMQRRKIQ